MIEFIKHLLGLCGESHLNIMPIILIVMLVGVTFKLKKI